MDSHAACEGCHWCCKIHQMQNFLVNLPVSCLGFAWKQVESRQCDPGERHGRVIRIRTVQIAQINGDIYILTAGPDTHKYLVTAMDYFSKWTKDKPLQNRLAQSVEGLCLNSSDIRVYLHKSMIKAGNLSVRYVRKYINR